MRLAILTRYRGATEAHGARVLASCAAGRIHVPWDYALDPEANHLAAARALATRLEWSGLWYGGSSPQGYVWVQSPGSERNGSFVTDGSRVVPCG